MEHAARRRPTLTLDEIEAEALSLPETSRVKLFERLLRSFDESASLDQDAARAWIEEAERRDRDIESGAEEIPAEEVFRRVRGSLR